MKAKGERLCAQMWACYPFPGAPEQTRNLLTDQVCVYMCVYVCVYVRLCCVCVCRVLVCCERTICVRAYMSIYVCVVCVCVDACLCWHAYVCVLRVCLRI